MMLEEIRGQADLEKIIGNGVRHGVILKFKLPANMRWDFEFARWGKWAHIIRYKELVLANALAMARRAKLRAEAGGQSDFAVCRRAERRLRGE